MFWNKKNKQETPSIPWHKLSTLEELDKLEKESFEKPVMLFKHSTRCNISGTALNRLERAWKESYNNIKPVYLDLIAHRDVSNAIEEKWDVEHQSPQMIVLKDGNAVYDASHLSIQASDLESWI